MAFDATACRNKTSVSLSVFSATIIIFFLLHVIVATAEKQDNNTAEMENHGNGDAAKENIEVHGPIQTDARGKQTNHGSSRWGDQTSLFNASAHEVPSGPNPVSNR